MSTGTAEALGGVKYLPPDFIEAYRVAFARSFLLDFTKATFPQYQVKWFHAFLCKNLDDLLAHKITRLMVFMPPQVGKSELVSRRLPAFALGRNPNIKVASCSYSADLSQAFNRQVQRIIDTKEYSYIFPETALSSANIRTSAKGNWLRNSDTFEVVDHDGSYKSVGVMGPLTGNKVDLGIIDDPIKDRLEAGSETFRNRLWEWYLDVFLTRLHNDSLQLLTMCMTGDTLVLMPDGTESPLCKIKVGDIIATYDNGKIVTSTVKNWKSQGLDVIFSIKTDSGIVVKANSRHPFLVCKNGELKWVRLKDLKKNDRMIRVGVHGKVKSAHLVDVKSLRCAKDIVHPITTKPDGKQDLGHHLLIQNHEEQYGLDKDTELKKKNTTKCLSAKAENVLSAECLQEKTLEHIGEANSVLTMTTLQERLGDSCVTTATSLSDMEKQKKHYNQLLNTCEILTDKIVEIKEIGKEEVFDIQVERTENFIANGLVSHNTRWHEDDLAGRILNHEADKWKVLCFPSIREDMNNQDDPRQIGDVLWPERHSLETILDIKKKSERTFISMHQQRPSPAEGNIIKESMIRYYNQLPTISKVVQSWDCAFEDKDTSDYVACTVWGISGNNFYLLYMHRGKWNFVETVNQIKYMCQLFPMTSDKIIERKANGHAIIQFLQNEIQGIVPFDPKDSKEARLYACSFVFEGGSVYFPSGMPWVNDVKQELLVAPNGKNDDIVDTITQFILRYVSISNAVAFHTGYGRN